MKYLLEEAKLLTEGPTASVSWDGQYLQINIPGYTRVLVSFSDYDIEEISRKGTVAGLTAAVLENSENKKT